MRAIRDLPSTAQGKLNAVITPTTPSGFHTYSDKHCITISDILIYKSGHTTWETHKRNLPPSSYGSDLQKHIKWSVSRPPGTIILLHICSISKTCKDKVILSHPGQIKSHMIDTGTLPPSVTNQKGNTKTQLSNGFSYLRCSFNVRTPKRMEFQQVISVQHFRELGKLSSCDTENWKGKSTVYHSSSDKGKN
jgi:hypothetical protein